MAFVYRSEREDIAAKSNATIGPGSYLSHMDRIVAPAYAPFNSKCPRKQEELPAPTPGPGTYADKSSIKGGQKDLSNTYHYKQKHSFLSTVQRFNTKKEEVPGPGSYDIISEAAQQLLPKTKSESNFAFLKMQSPPSIPSHESVFGYEEADQRMLLKQTNPDKVFKGEKGDTIGPGQYEIPSSFGTKAQTKGINWQRSKSKRDIHTMDKKQDSIGPGQYNTDKALLNQNIFPIYKFKNSSIFASKVPRMYSNPQKMRLKPRKRAALSAPRHPNAFDQNNDSSDEEGAPGPGFYYNPSATSDFSTEPYTGKSQYFGSTVERFPPKKDHTIGPGKYTTNSEFSVQKARDEKLKKSPVTTRERFKDMYKTEVPGPGQYKEQSLVEEISKKPWGKKGVFGSTSGRFQNKRSIEFPETQPGPGAYKPEASLKMLDGKKNSNIKRSSSMFLSSTVREPNKVKKFKNPSPPPGSYNLEMNSIAETVRRKVESGLSNPLLSSLKSKMKLIAPFNSCSQRFKQKGIKEHERFLGPGYYEFKTFSESSKPKAFNPQFLSSESRFSGAFDGNIKRADEPGPGNYNRGINDEWNKRTFNITFAD